VADLPSQPASPMRAQLQRDARDILLREDDPGVVRALYTAAGKDAGGGAEVLARVIDGEEMRRGVGRAAGGAGAGGGAATAGQHRRRTRTVQVAALLDGETVDDATGVGDEEGVEQLREHDRLLVPGWIVGAAEASAVLLVSRVLGLEAGLWTAEVGT
jgi:hypothetical protein